MLQRSVVLFSLICGLSLPAAVYSAGLDGWRLVEQAESEQLAVFASPDGQLLLVRPGEHLSERLTVTAIENGGVVLERPGEWGMVTIFVSPGDGRQSVATRERQPLYKANISGAAAVIAPAPGPEESATGAEK